MNLLRVHFHFPVWVYSHLQKAHAEAGDPQTSGLLAKHTAGKILHSLVRVTQMAQVQPANAADPLLIAFIQLPRHELAIHSLWHKPAFQ